MNIKFNSKVNKDNNIVFDIVNNFVYYYDKDNDIIIVNDIVNVFDKDKDKVNVNDLLNDNDIVFNSQLKNFKAINECYDIINECYDIINDNDNDNDKDNVFDLRHNNKYVNVIKIVNDNDIDNILNNVINNDNVFVLKDIDIDIKDNDNVFVLLSMNKDIYYLNEYQLNDYIILSYVKYNYDNDNVKVIVRLNGLKTVLRQLNYCYMTLDNVNSLLFYIEKIRQCYDKISSFKGSFNSKYITVQRKNIKKYIDKKQQFIKKYNYQNIDSFKRTYFDNFNVFDLSIKDFNMLRQYIINNDCYFDMLNKLTNDTYKSFKGSQFTLKEKINDIVKDNVNDLYKYDNDNDIDFDNDNIFDIEKIDNKYNFIDNDFVLYCNKTIKDKVINDNINKYVNDIDLFLKDISYCFDKVNIKPLLSNIDFDIQNMTIELNKAIYELNLSIKECQSIDIQFNDSFIMFNNDIDFDYLTLQILKQYDKDFDNVNDIKLYLHFLECLKDFVIDINNNNDFDNIKDYNIYDYSIYQSKLNKHNSIIKKEQSDFLKVAYNEKLNDFVITD